MKAHVLIPLLCLAASGQAAADISYNYLEAGYGFSAADLDFMISGIFNDANLSGELDSDGLPTQELTFVFGVSKTFSLNSM